TSARMACRDTMPRDDQAALLERFRERAATAVIVAYANATQRSSADFHRQAGLGSLLRLFLLEKAAYEIRYEIANRPGRIGAPSRGMARLVAELLTRDA